MSSVATNEKGQLMEALVNDNQEMLDMPSVGELVTGTIIDKVRNAVYVDLGSLGVGIIYARDFLDDADALKEANLGDSIQAMVARFDNEDDLIELSLRAATREHSWQEIRSKLETGEVFAAEIQDANKGGLIVRVHGVSGFLPVSQLAPDHYPRVEGGDRNKILDRLNEYIGQSMTVKVISADQDNEKLIVSEKAVVSDEMDEILGKISIGDEVSGVVSGVVDFGVFIKFSIEKKELEGLVHISELAWQRIDDPRDIVEIDQKVKAKIIGVDGLRISLSVKQLQDDPWKGVSEKYKVGDQIKGEVIKVTPFGGFVKLDKNIHGLIHISELSSDDQKDPESVLSVGDKKRFTIISLEPDEHRLGLSLRGAAKKEKPETVEKKNDDDSGAGDSKETSKKKK